VTADGRPVHEAFIARVAFACRPNHRIGLEPVRTARLPFGVVPCAPDERMDRYRAGVIHGPVSVGLRQPGRVELANATARLTPLENHPLRVAQQLCLREGQRLVVV
jgi:hypothetical protein